jgi:2-polyprenyl-3-methyl-5-hydroxy-6-metoxy-1,4-benzoquinol methylase/uncharacterized protein YbaR (Trm112 family)
MQDILLQRLACAFDACGGRLDVQTRVSDDHDELRDGGLRDGVLICRECEAPYPVIGGVPIVQPVPSQWMADYRESILASLAESGLASADAVALIDTFAQPMGPVEPLRFGDDWTDENAAGIRTVRGTEQADLFADFLHTSDGWGPDAVISTLLGSSPLGTLLDLGCGDGRLSASLIEGAEVAIAADFSLRAVLQTMGRVQRATGRPMEGVVVDAQELGLADDSVDTIVCANLIDLMDRPDDLLSEAARVLTPGGRLVLSTPEPQNLPEYLEEAGFKLGQVVDGVPWLRKHTDRYVQVYLTMVASAALP